MARSTAAKTGLGGSTPDAAHPLQPWISKITSPTTNPPMTIPYQTLSAFIGAPPLWVRRLAGACEFNQPPPPPSALERAIRPDYRSLVAG